MSKTGIILILGLIFMNLHVRAQDYYEQQEKEVDNLKGFNKLAILNLLTVHYSKSDSRKARKYGKEANLLADNFIASRRKFTFDEVELIIDSKLRYAKVLFERENYEDAQTVFASSKSSALAYDYVVGLNEANEYLHMIDSLMVNESENQNFLKRAMSDIDIGSAISNSANNVATSSELKLAQLAENRGDTAAAIVHYEKARDLLQNRGEQDKANEINDKILTFRSIQRVDSIRAYITNQEKDGGDGKVLDHKIKLDSTGVFVLVKVDTTQIIEQQDELEQLKVMAQRSEQAQDYEASLNYYKQFLVLQQKYQEDSALRVAAIKVTDAELKLLAERNKNADLNIATIQKEKEAEVQLKNTLIVVAIMITLATLFVLFMYLAKIKKHRQLTSAYSDLDIAKGDLESAERHISTLLSQQVSPEIASALIHDKPQRRKQFVAIMFLDIRGFTPIAEKMDPEQLIDYQNNVFGFMIEIIQKRHGNINQFMGDGFMATFGAPVSHGNDPRNAYQAGVEILKEIKRLNLSGTIPETTLGIGIHAGFVVTGNVGTESRKQFSVTGSTVIIAARVEQLNKTYDSQMIITEEVYKSLSPNDVGEEMPAMESVSVKGRVKPVKIIIINRE